jgi:hypothetical protein
MGISRIFPEPDVLFAEWMASHELNSRIYAEKMRFMLSSDMASYLQTIIQTGIEAVNSSADLQGKVVASPSCEDQKDPAVEKLRRCLEELQTQVKNLFRCPSVFKNQNGPLTQAVFRLNHCLQILVFIRSAPVLSIAKNLMTVIDLLKKGTFTEGVESQLTLKEFEAKLSDFKNLTDSLAKSYGDSHLNDQFHYTRETENSSLTSRIEHVVKLPELQDKPDGELLWKSQFEISSESTEHYLINDWLVVSTVSPDHQQAQPSPSVVFRDGDETVRLEIVDEKSKLPPDHLLRKEIIKSIQSWNKLQIKKMQAAMVTYLVGVVVFGSMAIISLNAHKAQSIAKLFQGAMFFMSIMLGYCSISSGIIIYEFYTLQGRVAYIRDLGLWVKQIRTYVRKYPILAHRFSAIQKFFTERELAWAKKAIESPKSDKKA